MRFGSKFSCNTKQIHILYLGLLVGLVSLFYLCNHYSTVEIISSQSFIIQLLTNRPQRIFCIILTHENYIHTRAQAVKKTWAQKCDAYKFVLKFTNVSKQEADESLNILEPPGLANDVYKKLTDKVYLTMQHVYQNYPGYDWYLKADDDTFVFFDNLRSFLAEKNPNDPVSYGQLYNVKNKRIYNSGGAGYVLSNGAFRVLGEKLDSNKTFCPNTGYEDVDVGACLRSLNVSFGITLDQFGKERFNHINIGSYFKGIFPLYLQKYTLVKPVRGMDCCSDNPISFHKMREKDIYRLHELIEEKRTAVQKLVFKDYVKKLQLL